MKDYILPYNNFDLMSKGTNLQRLKSLKTAVFDYPLSFDAPCPEVCEFPHNPHIARNYNPCCILIKLHSLCFNL